MRPNLAAWSLSCWYIENMDQGSTRKRTISRLQIHPYTLQWRHTEREASQITSLTIVYATVYSGGDQRKHQSSASPVNSPHKEPVTQKMFPFDDVMVQKFAPPPRRPGDKPLYEQMMVSLLTHTCVTRPQCLNELTLCMLHWKSNTVSNLPAAVKSSLTVSVFHHITVYMPIVLESFLIMVSYSDGNLQLTF